MGEGRKESGGTIGLEGRTGADSKCAGGEPALQPASRPDSSAHREGVADQPQACVPRG
ncbi:unnamed protein product [Linum tenue]|uniref:Uncharacterized protein n=1 Tax=Linum tenue TaxID=586396 RepID=A0AAV0PED9_9ROSI|nr:unnamed protein product [Linum tenue]